MRVPAVVVAAAALAVLAAPSALPRGLQPEPRSALAIRDGWPRPADAELVRIDPRTLAVQPGRVLPIGRFVWDSAFSPDGDGLALARSAEPGWQTSTAAVRFVDPVSLRLLGDVSLGARRTLEAMSWTMSGRLVAAVADLDRTGLTTGLAVVAIDPDARRVVGRQVLSPGTPVARAAWPGGLALVVGPSGRIGPASLVAVDAAGGVRTVALPGLRAGWAAVEGERSLRPGLAVDPDGGRAFVAAEDGTVYDVDLRTLAVGRHRPASTRAGAAASLRPATAAKVVDGSLRQAHWLGGGMLAVTGSDVQRTIIDGFDYAPRVTSAGVTLVDTGTWRVRRLSERLSDAVVSDGLLVAFGQGSAEGVAAFRPDGTRAWQRFAGRSAGYVGLLADRLWVPAVRGLIGDRMLDPATGHSTRPPKPRRLRQVLAAG